MRVLRYEGVLLDVPEWCKYVAANTDGRIYAYNARPTISVDDPTEWTTIGVCKCCGHMPTTPQPIGPLHEAQYLAVSPDTLTWALHVLSKFEYDSITVMRAPAEADYEKAIEVLRKIKDATA